jgi:phosphohistidine phosphatase
LPLTESGAVSIMRRLLLFRHANAERAVPGASDLARTLTAEGRADAAALGGYIARHDFRPDRALVSTAARTRETWQLVAGAMGDAPAAVFEARIYDASPTALTGVIRDAGANARTLLLMGHNPGLHELAMSLVATGDIDTRERLREKFPTCGLAIIDFAFERWADLHPRSGRLERFVSPKTIAAATN